jgi:integrase
MKIIKVYNKKKSKMTSQTFRDEKEKLRKSDEYIGLANKNSELLALNKELNQQLEIVVKELNVRNKKRQEKAALKEARANRKRLPKRDPMTPSIYEELIKASQGPSYVLTRLRIAFCILTVTGIRINELLPLKVYQLQNLLESHWIGIDRWKRDPSNHKAFLTQEGKKIVENRKRDFELIFLMKEPDCYVFTSNFNHYQMLSRETLTKDLNTIIRSISYQLPHQPNITSHSFRLGYIYQLWKDTKDIEFVRQVVGHRNIGSTSSYVANLSDKERQ